MVRAKQSRALRYMVGDACTRTLTVSNGWPTMACSTPAHVPDANSMMTSRIRDHGVVGAVGAVGVVGVVGIAFVAVNEEVDDAFDDTSDVACDVACDDTGEDDGDDAALTRRRG